MTTFTYGDETLGLVLTTYGTNGATAVSVVDATTGEPRTRLSVNMTPESDSLPDGVFYLKDWSENAAIAAAAIEAGVIVPVPDIPTAYSGHIWADAYRIAA